MTSVIRWPFAVAGWPSAVTGQTLATNITSVATLGLVGGLVGR